MSVRQWLASPASHRTLWATLKLSLAIFGLAIVSQWLNHMATAEQRTSVSVAIFAIGCAWLMGRAASDFGADKEEAAP